MYVAANSGNSRSSSRSSKYQNSKATYRNDSSSSGSIGSVELKLMNQNTVMNQNTEMFVTVLLYSNCYC